MYDLKAQRVESDAQEQIIIRPITCDEPVARVINSLLCRASVSSGVVDFEDLLNALLMIQCLPSVGGPRPPCVADRRVKGSFRESRDPPQV